MLEAQAAESEGELTNGTRNGSQQTGSHGKKFLSHGIDLERFADAPPKEMIELVQVLNKLDEEGARRNEVQYQRDNLLKTRQKLESNIDLVKKKKERIARSDGYDEVWSPIDVESRQRYVGSKDATSRAEAQEGSTGGFASNHSQVRQRSPRHLGGNKHQSSSVESNLVAKGAAAATTQAGTPASVQSKNPYAKSNSVGTTKSLRLTADALAMHEEETMPPKPILTPSQSVLSASSELSKSGVLLFKESMDMGRPVVNQKWVFLLQ